MLKQEFLSKIVEQKKIEVNEVKQRLSLAAIQDQLQRKKQSARDFFFALSKNGFACVAEIKQSSPSKGLLSHDFRLIEIARQYEAGGAKAISVLTDKKFFHGKPSYLLRVKEKVSLPILRKDFIIDEYQVYESKFLGADAILLIAEILSTEQIRDFLHLSFTLHMDCLVEGHTRGAIEKSVEAGAKVIGINNRDLNDFTLDMETSFRLKKYLPDDVLSVSESGIASRDDVKKLRDAGFHAVLIGETLMRTKNKALALQNLLNV